MNHKKNRILYLDVIRVVACMMVVLMHSPMPSKNAVGIFSVGISYFTMPCIGLFFAASGALLLPMHYSSSNNMTELTWIKHRLLKITFPVLIWSLFYIFINYIFDENGLERQFSRTIKALCSIPFSVQGHGVLWFMYVIAGLYLLAPVISPWLEKTSKKTLLFYLSLWGVSLCFPLLSNIIAVDRSIKGSLYYFSGYAGYFLLGYYLRHFGGEIKLKYMIPLYLCILPLPVIPKILNIEVDFYDIFWYLSIFSGIMVVFWWKIIMFIADKISYSILKNIIINISNLSFGIYLCHIFIMRKCLWPLLENVNNYYLQTFLSFTLTFCSALAVSWLISFLPVGNYIVGYKYSRA